MKLRWALCLVVANAACLRTTTFHCSSDNQCQSGGQHGRCESVGFCSFDDSACAGGRRFGDLSGAYANTCVGDVPGLDGGVRDGRGNDDAHQQNVVGGTVSGLTGSGLVLRNNNTDDLSVTHNGPFMFATQLSTGSHYQITVATPASGQDVYIGNGSGTVGSTSPSAVVVSCFTAGSDPGILCDTGIFCSAGSEVCCFDKDRKAGTCQSSGSQCSKVKMPCDSANECNGGSGVCCAQFKNGSGTQNGLQDVSCVSSASQCSAMSGYSNEMLCNPQAAQPCPSGKTCTGSSMLGNGYHSCQ